MRTLLLCLVIAGCATTAETLRGKSVAEVCYIGMTEPEHRPLADAEVARRNEDCGKHGAQIQAIREMEARGMGTTQGAGDAVRRPPSGGGMGMGRGY